MKIAASLLTLTIGVVATACSPPAGKPLTDGCYYAGAVPVLRVNGVKGNILIPGDISRVRVIADASPDDAGVTFEPGFHIVTGSPLKVQRSVDLPRSSMMMKPLTNEPTIMAIAEPSGLIDLVKGTPC